MGENELNAVGEEKGSSVNTAVAVCRGDSDLTKEALLREDNEDTGELVGPKDSRGGKEIAASLEEEAKLLAEAFHCEEETRDEGEAWGEKVESELSEGMGSELKVFTKESERAGDGVAMPVAVGHQEGGWERLWGAEKDASIVGDESKVN